MVVANLPIQLPPLTARPGERDLRLDRLLAALVFGRILAVAAGPLRAQAIGPGSVA
jgi:hypothetical protein